MSEFKCEELLHAALQARLCVEIALLRSDLKWAAACQRNYVQAMASLHAQYSDAQIAEATYQLPTLWS